MPALTITLCAKKGGVGKTSTAINLAAYLASEQKCRVLMIDADSQSSLSQFFMRPEQVDALRIHQTTAAVFHEGADYEPKHMIHPTSIEGLFITPASDHLEKFNWLDPHKAGPLQFGLRDFIKEVRDEFQFVLIDSPPQLGVLPCWAAMLAADFVLTPIVPELFSAQSIAGVDRTLSAAQELNTKLQFLGYVVNMKDKRRAYHDANETRLRAIHGDRVLGTVITNLTAFAEAQGLRQVITQYSKAGEAAKLTKELAREVLGRIQKSITQRQPQSAAGGERKVA